jgi:glutamate synthase (NADPH/NADH) small chain
VLCEGACVLQHEGQPPIAVAALQRYATDAARAALTPLRDRPEPNGRSVAVIGAGPAGLACAGELAARGFDVLVFDEHAEVGGAVRTAIAPYRQVVDPLPAEREALEALGVRFRLGIRIRSRDHLATLVEGADAIFLGVGLGADVELDCPGTELPGFWRSLPFIAELKHDRPVAVGRRVIVLGGGNTAIDIAREAIRLGAEHVTLAYRRTRDEMPAYGFEVEAAEAEGIRFEWLAAPIAVRGTGCVQRVVFDRMRLGAADRDGRRRPEPVAGAQFSLPADTVVAALGQRPRLEIAEWLDDLVLDRGRLVVDAQTGRVGEALVFSGGDAVNGGSSVVQAVAEGKRAARALEEALCPS